MASGQKNLVELLTPLDRRQRAALTRLLIRMLGAETARRGVPLVPAPLPAD